MDEKVRKQLHELQTYPGFLPIAILGMVDLNTYFESLKKRGLWGKLERRLSESGNALPSSTISFQIEIISGKSSMVNSLISSFS